MVVVSTRQTKSFRWSGREHNNIEWSRTREITLKKWKRIEQNRRGEMRVDEKRVDEKGIEQNRIEESRIEEKR